MKVCWGVVIATCLIAAASDQGDDWRVLFAQADSLQKVADYSVSLALAQRALALANPEFGANDTSVATISLLIGEIFRRQARYRDAEISLTGALAIRERVLQPDHSEIAEALIGLAGVYISERRFRDAEPLIMRGLTLVEQAEGSDNRLTGRLLTGLGNVYWGLGQYAQAEPVLMRARAIMASTDIPDSLGTASVLYSLGWVVGNTERCSDAEVLFRRALAIRESSLGPHHPDVAGVEMALGKYYLDQCRFAEAESLQVRALHTFTTALGDDHPAVANALGSLGDIYYAQNRLDDAERVFSRVLLKHERAEGTPGPDYSVALKRLADVYESQGRYSEARQLYQRGLHLFESTWGFDHPYCSAYLRGLACLDRAEERDEEAVELLQRALDIEIERYGVDHSECAYTLNLLAGIYCDGRQYDEAERYCARARSILEKTYSPDYPGLADVLSTSAKVAERDGRHGEAIQMEQRAWGIRLQWIDEGKGLAERNALEYSHFFDRESANYLSILFDTPSDTADNRRMIAEAVIASKSVVLDGILARSRALVEEADSETMKLADTLRRARFALSKLYIDGPGKDSTAVYRRKLDEARIERERLESTLARRSASFRQDQALWDAKSDDVIAALPVGAVLVEYMRYGHRLDFKNTESRYVAVVLKSGGEPAVFPLGSAAEIDTAVYWYRQHFANPGKIRRENYPAISEGIYSRCWRPFAALLKDANTVFVSPDGALNLVSFAGLMDENRKYLVEQYSIHYLSTGRDLIRLQKEAQSGTGLLAMGDADFDATAEQRLGIQVALKRTEPAFLMLGLTRGLRSGCQALSELKVASLPATRTEVEEVSTIWRAESTEPEFVFYDENAGEEKLKSECSGKRVVHLATHGFYIGGECAPKGKDVIGENPMLHSGLLLAGANLKGAGADSLEAEDGIVTAEEIAGLNMHGTEMVVLSACETGLGDVKSGEGVFGLRRAFQMAGARTVVSALWQVDDQCTATLMQSLYTNKGRSIPEALRTAELELIESRRAAGKSDHPFYWAGFIATGDWQNR